MPRASVENKDVAVGAANYQLSLDRSCTAVYQVGSMLQSLVGSLSASRRSKPSYTVLDKYAEA